MKIILGKYGNSTVAVLPLAGWTAGLVMAVFDRGDVSVPVGPAFGHEQKGVRPARKARRV